jgi:hypothetical protein
MNKNRSIFLRGLLGVGVLTLLVSAFWTGKSYAATGCFNDTNGHWAETFICWMKDNNITTGIGGGNYGPEQYVTRAQMAVFMQKQANVPPATGQILIAGGMNNYVPLSATSTLSMTHYSNRLAISRPTIGSEWIGLTPDMPTVLYGKSLQLAGIELCYKASANAYLSIVDVKTILDSTSVGNYTTSFYDTTDYTDHTCRYFTLSTPLALQSEHASISFYLLIQWALADSTFELSRTTFVLQPTDVAATLPAGFSNPKPSILQEGTPPEGDSTTGQ